MIKHVQISNYLNSFVSSAGVHIKCRIFSKYPRWDITEIPKDISTSKKGFIKIRYSKLLYFIK